MESCAVSEADFRERMYDKYSLNLQDMQVMVTTCSRESWKFAQLRGSSHLHVIDRFNISLQMERRILFTDDPQVTLLSKIINIGSSYRQFKFL